MGNKEKFKKPIKPGKRYWDRTKSAIGNPERLLVELITNSIDSYKRLRSMDNEASGKVQIKYIAAKSGSANIEVKDWAEGIPFERLRTIVEEYGEDSSGLSDGFPVRGTVGVGLKDVGILMENCRIITIHNGKLNKCKIYLENGMPFVEYLIIDKVVTSDERKKLGISQNGTIVKGALPKDTSFIRDFKVLNKRLSLHYMLRKVLQRTKLFRIIMMDNKNDQKVLKYTAPKAEVLYEKISYIPFLNVQYRVKITIKRALKRLTQSGEFREGGLVVVYNRDAVADCSLFGFDSDSYARRLFGEIDIQAEVFKVAKLFDPKKSIIDAKRKSGLDFEHPFVQLLMSEVQANLRRIIEEERKEKKGSKESVIKSRNSRNDIISKFNSMARKELKEKKDVRIPPLPPLWTLPEPPDFFKFYYQKLDILKNQKTIIGLGILPEKVPDGTSIIISCNDPSIQVVPKTVFVDSTKAIYGLIREKITLVGNEIGIKGSVTAEYNRSISRIEVTVQENPLLNPKNGFEFMPNSISIVQEKKKKTDLIIDRTLITQGIPGKVTFESSTSDIHCPSEIRVIPGIDRLGDKVERFRVPIKGNKARIKGTVTASYKNKEAIIYVHVIKKRELAGMFSDFKFSQEELPLLSEYDPETGIITIYVTHPMYKKHNEMGRSLLRIFVIDTIIRTACEAIVREGIKRQSAKFPILGDISGGELSGFQFISEFSLRIEELFHSHGSSLCEALGHIKLNLP